MGYFDAIVSGSFKTAKDNRKLFFPWGAFGRGYIIPSEAYYKRLHRTIKISSIICLPLMIFVVAHLGAMGAGILLILAVAPYALWAHIQCRGMERADESLTVSESIANQARQHNAISLWLLEIGALIFVAAGIYILIIEPRNRLIALAAIVFFGFCAIMFAKMLIMKRRQ